jgi:hypothetical protein
VDQSQSNPIKPKNRTGGTPGPLPSNQSQSDLIKPKNHTGGTPVPLLTPEEVAYNAWFRMHIRAVPFDYELLQKLHAAIPKKQT